MTGRDVQREFRAWWRECLRQCPAYANDKPAKREAFSVFVDMLHREGRISDNVAYRVTLS